jgi:two-component system, OmpR family, response regulator TctD
MRFLLIEDNADLAISVRDRLALDGYGVDWANGIGAAKDCLAGASYDLILLDIMLPDGDGRTFLQSQRKRRVSTPIIVITARSDVSDRVHLLDLGADDYITKPFDFLELEARCRAVIRRKNGAASNVKHFGNLEFDSLSATVKIAGRIGELRNRELRLMEIFFSSPEQIFPKSQLIDRLFSYAENVSENAIEVYVGRLRQKIEGANVRIETIRGVGYRMTRR